MSDIVQDIGKIWQRLFDHKSFLTGEINFLLQEFEHKRGDKEVDNLFNTIENITDISNTKLKRLKSVTKNICPETNQDLEQALLYCDKFVKLEESFNKNEKIEERRSKRKIEWEKFMDDITSTYSEINTNYECKEEELRKKYEELEKKLDN